ncbi:MAG TPA: thioredoxin-disulfide reductase [Aggregatilineales bacterium]|nr:thioredoxin-disulfide reductase [Aggregatilineales bacterium]
MERQKVLIIGSGPAGLTAALYTARANLSPVVIAGPQIGGQVALTHEIENYPGFPGGSGTELIELMQKQAESFGARVEVDVVLEVDLSKGSPFYVRTGNKEYLVDALIATSGASPRLLEVPGERELTGRGVSYCGTCDGFFFRGKKIVVIGGGDSAIKEALFLTRFATHIDVIHRRDSLRAEAALQQRAFENPKINFIWDTVVEEVVGEDKVQAVKLRHLKTGESTEHPTEGAFIFIGHEPNNSLYLGALAMDEGGYLITDKRMATSIEGVFAAGEIQDPVWKQVATSVGQGCAAAIAAEEWLAEREHVEA